MKELYIKNSNENIKDLFKNYDKFIADITDDSVKYNTSFEPFNIFKMFVDGSDLVIAHALDDVDTYKTSEAPYFAESIDKITTILNAHGNAVIGAFGISDRVSDIDMLGTLILGYVSPAGEILDSDNTPLPMITEVSSILVGAVKFDDLPISTAIVNNKYVNHKIEAQSSTAESTIIPLTDNTSMKDKIFAGIVEGSEVDAVVGNYDVFPSGDTLTIPLFTDAAKANLIDSGVVFDDIKAKFNISSNITFTVSNWELVLDLTSITGSIGFVDWEIKFSEFWSQWVYGKQNFSYKFLIHK